jgi:hypothetical protein
MIHVFRKIKNTVTREVKKWKAERNWHSKGLPVEMNSKKKKELIARGFYPSTSLFFDFENFGYDLFLNERDYKKMYPINRPSVSSLIDSKAYLPVLFRSRPEWLPDFYANFQQGQPLFHQGITDPSQSMRQILKSALEKFGPLIVKPTTDGGGRKIIKLDAGNFEEQLDQLLARDVVIVSTLQNESFLKEIFPLSLNTMRVMFFKTPARKNKILMIGQRFGTQKSKLVDNISSGGLGYTVDLISGKFSKPYSFTIPFRPEDFYFHPDTGADLKNFQYPDWQARLSQIQEIVDYLDFVEYAGLDLAFTPSGIKVVEINSHPESIFFQLDQPALLDPEFKEFIFSRKKR